MMYTYKTFVSFSSKESERSEEEENNDDDCWKVTCWSENWKFDKSEYSALKWTCESVNCDNCEWHKEPDVVMTNMSE